ncbi:MAG: hypothetical protein KAS32_04990 [Candidatus Peribacteraceae bacterium]|nr:hypothetical protein [Candidatus Peribacteraceae bacterium]
MREIKFRAWDKVGKWMIKVGGIDWNKHNMFRPEPNDYSYNLDSVILMQYTGLKDKNGVEIYEGDLYYDHKRSMYPCEVYYDERYAEFRGRINGEMQPDKTYSLMFHKSWEVIGNIYENSELVKE